MVQDSGNQQTSLNQAGPYGYLQPSCTTGRRGQYVAKQCTVWPVYGVASVRRRTVSVYHGIRRRCTSDYVLGTVWAWTAPPGGLLDSVTEHGRHTGHVPPLQPSNSPGRRGPGRCTLPYTVPYLPVQYSYTQDGPTPPGGTEHSVTVQTLANQGLYVHYSHVRSLVVVGPRAAVRDGTNVPYI